MSPSKLSLTTFVVLALLVALQISWSSARIVKRQADIDEPPPQGRDKRFWTALLSIGSNLLTELFPNNDNGNDERELSKRDIDRRQAQDEEQAEQFNLLDLNKDGVVDFSEGLSVLEQAKSRRKRQIEKEDVAAYTAGFESLDKNGDGVIAPDEIPQ